MSTFIFINKLKHGDIKYYFCLYTAILIFFQIGCIVYLYVYEMVMTGRE